MSGTETSTTRTSEGPGAPQGWEPLFPESELSPGTLQTVKRGPHQLVVGRGPDGAPFALDNRCPHEGYPLAQGTLEDCKLTCTWHNWKFDVRDGSCVLGGEAVRCYPTRVRGGVLEVDLTPPDPRAQYATWLASLREGLQRGDIGRTLRDGVRLLDGGFAPERLLAEVARHDGLHAEYGTTHALPVCADALRALPRRPGAAAMAAIAPAIDMCAEANRRLPERPRPAALPGTSVEALLEAVESEDAATAEGLVLGALAEGRPWREVESWLWRAVALHFTDFGHQAIYLTKAHELLEAAGEEYAADLLSALTHSIVLGTREDTLPYMQSYFRRLEPLAPELAALAPEASQPELADALRRAALDGSLEQACDTFAAALRGGAGQVELAQALLLAAAERLRRFDVRIDTDPTVAETWLWATHRLTFAAAVRVTLARGQHPDANRLLLQALAFVHSGRAMDAPPELRLDPAPIASDAAEVVSAIAGRRTEEAVARAAGCLAAAPDGAELYTALEELCLSDPLVRPIVVAHAIKTTCAAFEERAALGEHPDRDLPVLALVRFLASPIVERRVRQTVETSIDWVVGGRVPRKLTQ